MEHNMQKAAGKSQAARIAKGSVLCLGIAVACGIYYALNVSVLPDGSWYEPKYCLLAAKLFGIASVILAGGALWQQSNAK